MKTKILIIVITMTIISLIILFGTSMISMQRSFSINYIDKNELNNKISSINSISSNDLKYLTDCAESIDSAQDIQLSSYRDNNYFLYPGKIITDNSCLYYDQITNNMGYKIGIYNYTSISSNQNSDNTLLLFIKDTAGLGDNSNNGNSFWGLLNKKEYNENATIGMLYCKDIDKFKSWKNNVFNNKMYGDFYYIEPITESLYAFCFLHYDRVNSG